MMRGGSVLFGAVLALVLGASAVRGTGGTGGVDPLRRRGGSQPAHKRVPEDIRAGCRFTDVRTADADPTVIAAVDCTLPGDAAADTLSYPWYETLEDADAAYDAVVSQEESPLQADGCGAYEGEYTIDDEDGGRYTCLGLGSTTSIVYTYKPFPVVGVITDVSEPGDVESMGELFDNDAGPESEDGTIPSLQSQKFGARAAKALRQRIPKAIFQHCEPNGDSFTSPWVAFEYGAWTRRRGSRS